MYGDSYIDAGSWYGKREVIIVEERELVGMSTEELKLLERMLSEAPTGKDVRAYSESGFGHPRVMIEIIPEVPCITQVKTLTMTGFRSAYQ